MKKEILAVSNNMDVLGLLKKKLIEMGPTIFFASDKETATILAKERAISVIIVDYDKNSILLLENLRKLLPYSIQIILLDLDDAKNILTEIHDGKSYRFIIKPIEKEKLLVTVSNALEDAKSIRHQKLLDRAFFSCVEVIFYTSEKGKIEWINPAVKQLFGYTHSEVVGQSIDFFDVNDHAVKAVRFEIMRAVKKNKKWQGYYWVKNKLGEQVPISMTVNLVELESGEHCYVFSILDITDEYQYRQFIEQQAYYDHLTGLPNRWLFSDRAEKAILKAKRDGLLVAVFFIDLDNFKPVNDCYGHPMGDLLLQEVAARLQSHIRKSDTVARFGGDEFAILMSEFNKDENTINQFCQSLNKLFDEPFQVDGQLIEISLSIGVALYPESALNATDLVRFADQAMYHVKNSGRGNYHIYQSHFDAV